MAGISALVDTNVVLDVLARRRPHYEDAARIWTLAETGQLEAYVAAGRALRLGLGVQVLLGLEVLRFAQPGGNPEAQQYAAHAG